MGLGKTVQVIAFLAGLDCSELLSDGGRFRGLGPTLIVCPATLLEQWVDHFHSWYPSLRVASLHQSGSYHGDPKHLIRSMKTGGVLLTSYSGIVLKKSLNFEKNCQKLLETQEKLLEFCKNAGKVTGMSLKLLKKSL